MSRLENPSTIEVKVGAQRHATDHIARAVSAEQRVYLLHPRTCVDDHGRMGVSQIAGFDQAGPSTVLQRCPYSAAMDRGIHLALWRPYQDQPVIVRIDQLDGDLVPYRPIPTALAAGNKKAGRRR